MRRPCAALAAFILLALPAAASARPRTGPTARLDAALAALRAGSAMPGLAAGADRVTVDVTATSRADLPALAAALRRAGMTVEDIGRGPAERVVEGRIAVDALDDAAALGGVQAVRAVWPGESDTGGTLSQGDAVHRGPEARAAGATGAGIVVGVISDSIDRIGGGVAASQASGDLPASVTVLKDDETGEDEGRAMAEIVYDTAPGIARIAFASGTGDGATVIGAAGKADSIRRLVSAGARVVADDIYYVSEPMFQDGVVAQAADAAAASGVAYFASAGNRARWSWEGRTDFSGGPMTQTIGTVGAGDTAGLSVQWDERWGGATTDLDIDLVDKDTQTVLRSAHADNVRNGLPLEIASWTNTTTAPVTVELRVARAAGTRAPLLKWIAFGDWATVAPDRPTASPTVNVDAASAAGAMAVAAVRWSAPTAPESFSSRGPVTRLFDAAGNRLATPVVRAKPELAAADGVATSVPGFQPFYGTSAAAPSAAGVGALLLSAEPRLTPAMLRAIVTDPASVTACGAAFGAADCGAGLVRADAALTLLRTLAAAVPAVDAAVTGAPPGEGGWSRGDVGVHFTVGGRTLETGRSGCADATLTTDGSLVAGCTVDALGGSRSRTVTLRRDATPPATPLLTGLPDAAVASPMGLPAAPGCVSVDAPSGLRSCTVAGYGLAPGTHVITATATDVAGNTSAAQRVLTVRALRAADLVAFPRGSSCRRRGTSVALTLRAPVGTSVRRVRVAVTGRATRTVTALPATVRIRRLQRARTVVRTSVTFTSGRTDAVRRTYRVRHRC